MDSPFDHRVSGFPRCNVELTVRHRRKLRTSELRWGDLTEIITIVVRFLPAALPDVDVAAAGRNLGHSRVAVHAGVVGSGDPLASGVVTSANSAGVEFGRRIQDVIAPGRLALAVNAYVKRIGTAGCPIDHFVA